jgi:hypothetical protein
MILPQDEVSRTRQDAYFSWIKQPTSVKKDTSSTVTKENSETELSSTISCEPGVDYTNE